MICSPEQLRGVLERGQTSDTSEFLSGFKNCVDDIDSQYLDIRNARKAVFQDDPAGRKKIMGMSLED
jgi:hypothetical protein